MAVNKIVVSSQEELRKIIEKWQIDLATVDVSNVRDMSFLFRNYPLIWIHI